MEREELHDKRNVVLVGKGKKITGGVNTGRDAIVVGVLKKQPLSQLKKKDIVPKTLHGMETDVIEVSQPEVLEIDRTAKHRPAFGGISLGHKDITAGTFGMVVRESGVRYILTNNHVGANVNKGKIGDAWYQPGPDDGGTAEDEIAKLAEFIPIAMEGEEEPPEPPPEPPECVIDDDCPSGYMCQDGECVLKPSPPSPCPVAKTIVKTLNFLAIRIKSKTRYIAVHPRVVYNIIDCSLGKPDNPNDITDEILEIGTPGKVVEPEVDMKVKKCGRTTGLTKGKIEMVDVSLRIFYKPGYAMFTDQMCIIATVQGTVFGAGGDSGSIIVTEDNEPVGLLFAGGSDHRIYANRFSNVAKALNLD